ncbi:hypothetical protein BJV74DRAFT_883061 [Russula compacta]|nr:hypothetical protein BJV74DRAFT_883061 [Russula compacta]
MSRFSARQRPKARTLRAAQGSEILQMYQTSTQLNSPGETVSFSEPAHKSEADLGYVKPTSDYEYLEHYTSQSPAQSITTSTVEPQFGQDKDSSGILERNLFSTNPLPPSFDALEFPTSPLPPSSPFLSSTTHESLLSLRQMSHEAETTLLDFHKIPLPSTVGGSCEVSSFPRYGGSRFKYQTPGLASVSPLLHLPNLHSGLANKVPPICLASSCKADLIPDLLTCEDPWNVIGDVLGLPPIPSADATYFCKIRSLHTIPYEHVSSVASFGLGQVDVGELPITARDEGTRLKAVQSAGDPFIRPDSSQRLVFSCEALRHASSPLLCQDSPVKRVLSPARSSRSGREVRLLGCAESRCLSPSTSGNIPVLGEALPCLFGPQTLPSPRAPDGTPGAGWGSSSSLVKTPSLSPHISIPQRPTSPSSKNSNSLKTSASRSPEVVSKQWNEITGSDLVAPIPKVPIIQTTASRVHLSKLEFPDLFQDEEENFGSLF